MSYPEKKEEIPTLKRKETKIEVETPKLICICSGSRHQSCPIHK